MVHGTYNEFDGISECSIEQATKGLTQLGRDLFSRERKDSGERDNGKEIDHEDSYGVPVGFAGNDADWNKDKENIDGAYRAIGLSVSSGSLPAHEPSVTRPGGTEAQPARARAQKSAQTYCSTAWLL